MDGAGERAARDRRGRVVVVVVTGVLVAGLASGVVGPEERVAFRGSTAGVREAGDHGLRAHVAAGWAQERDDDEGEPTPGELRVRLESLLGHHALLATRLTRSALRGDPDLVGTAADALSENTEDLAGVIADVYGDAAADAFASLWSEHTRQFFVYAKGLADDDPAAQERAVAALDDYRAAFARFVSEATDGALPAAAVEANLGVHVDHILRQADAYAAGDHDEAYALQREAYAHMFPTGQTLAGGFAPSLPGEFPVPVDAEAQQLRSTLGMLLGEHVDLAIEALRAGLDGAPDFDAASAALDGNSADVTAGLEAVFGEDSGRVFADVWGDHIELLADYAAAVAADDAAARSAASDGLDAYHGRLGALLADATGGRADAAEVGALLAEHDAQVLGAVDAHAAGDHRAANAVAFDGYQHMFATAAVLAAAIEGAAEEAMPTGGAATGAGGAAALRRYRAAREVEAVAPPTAVRIPAIGVVSPLEHVGRDADGAVGVPSAWDQAAWFAEGPRPGQRGPAVVLGHVDSRSGPAVFDRVDALHPGDEVLVDRADGSTARFVVERVERHPKEAFPTDRVYFPTLAPTLRLVTCGGTFDTAAGSYRDNVVVFADLAER